MRYSGDLSMKKLLNEYIESDKFELGKAGYIKEDGTFIFMEEYHGEDDSLYQFKYPEFSNTHPEEDTCVRIFNEPNEIQYKKLEEIINLYLDNEEYCKIEIWNKGKYNFYKVFSLREGACEDYQWDENVGNWTGYKLVQIIKNNVNKLNEALNEVFDLNKYINDRFSNNLYNFPVDGPSYITPDGQFIDIIGISEDMGDDFPEDFPCHGAIQTIMNLEGKADKGGYYDDGSPLLRKNGYIRVNDVEQENNYIELSNIKPTYDQYIALEKWLDHNSHKYNYITICTEQFKDHQKYSYSEYITDDIVKNIKRYYTTGRLVEDMEDKLDCFLTENLLLEMNRGQLINKSKASDNYKDTSKGRNRWERRNKSKIATRVDQYNKIDMNSFFKNDELKVGINVHGETSDYIVAIRYNGVLKEIAEQIKRNNNRLEFKCILIALQRVFNQGNVFVSCSCPDWKYRQAYHATRGGYNSGTPEIRASDITNPRDSKGAGCKHVNLVLGNIDWIMKIASVINNYIHYMEDHFERKYADLIFPKLYGMPYQKAIQLNLFDTDDNLNDDEDEIKLSNRYGRERTKFRSDRQVNNMRNFNKQNSINNTNKPTLDLNMNKVKDEIKTNIRTNNIFQEEQNKKED